MTLLETFCIINRVALAEPNVNTTVNTGNIFDLNTDNTQVKYGAFCIQQQEHIQEGDYIRYNFNLFYVDRLLENRKNKLEVQSTGISTLQNIINGLKDIDLIDVDTTISYQTFTERFAAECAGAYCSMSIISQTPLCYEDYLDRINYLYGDFNFDFSADFFVKKLI